MHDLDYHWRICVGDLDQIGPTCMKQGSRPKTAATPCTSNLEEVLGLNGDECEGGIMRPQVGVLDLGSCWVIWIEL
jgi:hypothetical protein